jgi:hypothetical protein
MNLETLTESSQDVAERIEQFVHNRTGGMIRDLHVDVVDGEVLLTGHTTTYYNKQLATHAAFAVLNDIRRLTNDIEVN